MYQAATLRGVRLQHHLRVIDFALTRLDRSDVTHILVGEIVHEKLLQAFHPRFLKVMTMREFLLLAVFVSLDIGELRGVHLLLVVDGERGVVRVIL